MEEVVACTFCMEVPAGAIFGCAEGHIVCGPCKANWNGPCGICRGPLITRMRPLEALRDQLHVFRCDWCAFTGTRAAVDAHGVGCLCRPVGCPCLECAPHRALLAPTALRAHLDERHGDDALCLPIDAAGAIEAEVIVDGSVPTLNLFPTQADGALCGVVVRVDSREGAAWLTARAFVDEPEPLCVTTRTQRIEHTSRLLACPTRDAVLTLCVLDEDVLGDEDRAILAIRFERRPSPAASAPE